MSGAYYNEIDEYAAQWLRNLISAGHIAPGDVDTRSTEDVKPDDLRGYTQCHFFAGIGVWSYALRRAGWPDSRRVWTASCPCQPFSAAGKGAGFADERHLWPAFYHLVTQCRPDDVFGEQVASGDGLTWLDLVQTDMEAARYSFGAIDLCAAGVGAPHIRQRLYWVADSNMQHEGSARNAKGLRGISGGSWGRRLDDSGRTGLEGLGRGPETAGGRLGAVRPVAATGELSGVAYAHGGDARAERQQRRGEQRQQPEDCGATGWVVDSDCTGRLAGQRDDTPAGYGAPTTAAGGGMRPGPTNGMWRDADWLLCRDGKWRAVEPGTFPLAHGAPARVGRLRAYGNAIVAPLAETFIRAYMSCKP